MNYKDMTLHVSATEFRRRQGHFVDLAHKGATVIVNSRRGAFEVTPVTDDDDESWLTPEVCAQLEEAIKQVERGETHTFDSVEELDAYIAKMP